MNIRDFLYVAALVMIVIGVVSGLVAAFETTAVGLAVIKGGLTFGGWALAAVVVAFASDFIGGKKS